MGVPVICGGDEIDSKQQGINNVYCLDNEPSWFDWEHLDETLLAFTTRLVQFRKAHPNFQRRRWFAGRPLYGENISDICWFKLDGTPMADADWQAGFARSLGVILNGDAIPNTDRRGERIVDDSFCLLFNAYHEPLEFKLPPDVWGERWTRIIDTNDP